MEGFNRWGGAEPPAMARAGLNRSFRIPCRVLPASMENKGSIFFFWKAASGEAAAARQLRRCFSGLRLAGRLP
jgi:hypothetical protein